MREAAKGTGPRGTGNNARDASVLEGGLIKVSYEPEKCYSVVLHQATQGLLHSLTYPPPFKDYNGEGWYCGH